MKKILCLILSFALIFSVLSTVPVMAGERTYSNVLDDLEKDSTFDASVYPDNAEDVSVKLIQMAESEDGQLFLYVYQPADSQIDLECVSVSISVGFSANGEGLSPKLYDLILVSTEGVFDKYLVNEFALPDEAERYYNIVSLYREFNSVVDPESDKTEYKDTVCKAYAVGQQWCAYTINDRRVYEMNTFKTVNLDIKLSSTVMVKGGLDWVGIGLDHDVESHYVVFECTQFDIAHIYNATVLSRSRKYKQNAYVWGLWEGARSYPDGEGYTEQYIQLSDKEPPVVSEGVGLWSKEYTFERIMSGLEFKENLKKQEIEAVEDVLTKINDNYWVFSYLETELTTYIPGSATGVPGLVIEYTGYEAEGYILQVEFMDTSGNVYDLGVVSDGFKSTGTSAVGGGVDIEAMFEDLQKILSVFFVLVGVILIVNVCQIIFPIVKVAFSVVLYPFKAVWILIFGKRKK